MKYYNDVKLFHDKFGLVTPNVETYFIADDLKKFRVNFLNEELQEYINSYEKNDLPIAVDSLIDLVYITIGTALFHGLTSDVFDIPDEVNSLLTLVKKVKNKKNVSLLNISYHLPILKNLQSFIGCYAQSHNIDDVKFSLNCIYWQCIIAAGYMGIIGEKWDIMWDDVQRANMSKERVLKINQSKRGSIYDVIKPPGWIPPQSELLINQMINGEI